MALVAHRMMLPSRHRRSNTTTTTTTQQVARNKVGVLLVPSVAEYYGGEQIPSPALGPTSAASQQQLHLQLDPQETANADGSGGKLCCFADWRQVYASILGLVFAVVLGHGWD